MKICFLVGSMKISGGTYVIVQHAYFMQEQGHQVTLAVQEPFHDMTASWHDRSKHLDIIPISESYVKEFDLVIATWWKTVLELPRFPRAVLAYFVQSIESRFYAENEIPLKKYIDNTYSLPIHFCTEAKWIQHYLLERHSQQSELVRNGIRKDLYFAKDGGQARKFPRVLIEGPFNVGFKNTGMAVAAAHQAGAKDIWVLTGSPVSYVPYVSKIFSQVPISEVPDIYRECDILIKLSTVEGMFGPPLEMFHCGGTSVVLDVTGHDEYIIDGVNSTVIKEREFDAIVNRISEQLLDLKSISTQKSNARETANHWPDWDQSSAEFTTWVESLLASPSNSDIHDSLVTSEQLYISEENARLEKIPLLSVRNKIVRILSRSPELLKRFMFQLIAVKEVIFPSKTAL
jgi:glycosyltransferase involved in cell wall biosynthesis